MKHNKSPAKRLFNNFQIGNAARSEEDRKLFKMAALGGPAAVAVGVAANVVMPDSQGGAGTLILMGTLATVGAIGTAAGIVRSGKTIKQQELQKAQTDQDAHERSNASMYKQYGSKGWPKPNSSTLRMG